MLYRVDNFSANSMYSRRWPARPRAARPPVESGVRRARTHVNKRTLRVLYSFARGKTGHPKVRTERGSRHTRDPRVFDRAVSAAAGPASMRLAGLDRALAGSAAGRGYVLTIRAGSHIRTARSGTSMLANLSSPYARAPRDGSTSQADEELDAGPDRLRAKGSICTSASSRACSRCRTTW